METNRYNLLLETEADAFDSQINERISNGHVPDLKKSTRCEWFYNNVWRDPYYANLLYGRIVNQILHYIKENFGGRCINILEVACGPGHISLELVRAGHNVTGVDISESCIIVAEETAKKADLDESCGEIKYMVKNIFDLDATESFDMIVFSCALHHFDNQKLILTKVSSLLNDNGLVFVSEPSKIVLSDNEALIILTIRRLLGYTNHYYQFEHLEASFSSIEESIRAIQNEFQLIDESGDKVQSPLDNEANQFEMLTALKEIFEEIDSGSDFTFFDRIVGGIRMDTNEQEHQLAHWLRLLDSFYQSKGLISPQQFYFVGKKPVLK